MSYDNVVFVISIVFGISEIRRFDSDSSTVFGVALRSSVLCQAHVCYRACLALTFLLNNDLGKF